ncbi:MAG TPA: hypothetical protein PLP74_14210, partial [Quisquiliibacterium sp.]|nr:hypothetical protein [Quisquiliibacterium sp.]
PSVPVSRAVQASRAAPPVAAGPRPLALQRATLAAVAPELERVLRRLGGTIVAGPNGDHG